MSYTKLNEEASKAHAMLVELNTVSPVNEAVIASILTQVDFIRVSAQVNIDPIQVAINQKKPFTFGILSSKNFASPKEMLVKEQLDKVSELMSLVHENSEA